MGAEQRLRPFQHRIFEVTEEINTPKFNLPENKKSDNMAGDFTMKSVTTLETKKWFRKKFWKIFFSHSFRIYETWIKKGTNTSGKPNKTIGIDQIQLKRDFVDESFVNGKR